MKNKGLWIGVGCVAALVTGYDRYKKNSGRNCHNRSDESAPFFSSLDEGTAANSIPPTCSPANFFSGASAPGVCFKSDEVNFRKGDTVSRNGQEGVTNKVTMEHVYSYLFHFLAKKLTAQFLTRDCGGEYLEPSGECDDEYDNDRKYNLEMKSDMLDFYDLHKAKFKYDPSDDCYWVYLTGEDLKEEDGTMASDALPARKWLLRTEANLLSPEITKVDVSFLHSQGVIIPPEVVLSAESLFVDKPLYLNDPSYLRKYSHNVHIRTKTCE